MINPIYNRLLVAAFIAASIAALIIYPAQPPSLTSAGSNVLSLGSLHSNTTNPLLKDLILKDIVAIPIDDHTGYHPDLAERDHIKVDAARAKPEDAAPRQLVRPKPEHAIHFSPRRPRAIDRGYDKQLTAPRITNIHLFSGPEYGRVIIDLSCAANYTAERADSSHIVVRMGGAISPALDQSLFTLGESGLIKRIILSDQASESARSTPGVSIAVDVASDSDYSVLQLSDPSRIVIELHSKIAQSDYPLPDKDAVDIPSTISKSLGGQNVPSAASRSLEDDDADSRGADEVSTPAKDAVNKLIANDKQLVSWRMDNRVIENSILTSVPTISDKKISRPTDGVNQPFAVIDPRIPDSPIKCIVIDAGHGGHDPGAVSANGILEKEVVFDIAQRLRALIKARYPRVEVVMTRESDTFIPLDRRVALANCRGADLFVSIHANASSSPTASGVETFYVDPNRESSQAVDYRDDEDVGLLRKGAAGCESSGVSSRPVGFSYSNRWEESEELARHLQTALVQGIGSASLPTARDRGVKHAPFSVLLGAHMPSVLAEVSFLSNPRDAELLRSSQFRQRIAESLFSGLDGYLINRPVSPTQNRK